MSEIYENFMKEYYANHELCPKCGTKPHKTTLIDYVFNSSEPDEYKDLNRCTCSNCGDVHTCHERISLKEFNVKKELEEIDRDMRKNLTVEEWNELVTLGYVLTWGYTDNEEEDLKRHKYLSEKRWGT